MPSDTLLGVIVNQTLADRLGWLEPLGKKVELGNEDQLRADVIGVMKDYHQTGMYNEVESLMMIYRMRWDIEIQFRAWKQSLRMDKALDRSSSPHHIYALILATMIHLLLTLMVRSIAQPLLKPGELSLEKLAKSLSQFILKADRFERCWDFLVDLRHVKKDSRKRTVPVTEGFEALA